MLRCSAKNPLSMYSSISERGKNIFYEIANFCPDIFSSFNFFCFFRFFWMKLNLIRRFSYFKKRWKPFLCQFMLNSILDTLKGWKNPKFSKTASNSWQVDIHSTWIWYKIRMTFCLKLTECPVFTRVFVFFQLFKATKPKFSINLSFFCHVTWFCLLSKCHINKCMCINVHKTIVQWAMSIAIVTHLGWQSHICYSSRFVRCENYCFSCEWCNSVVHCFRLV